MVEELPEQRLGNPGEERFSAEDVEGEEDIDEMIAGDDPLV